MKWRIRERNDRFYPEYRFVFLWHNAGLPHRILSFDDIEAARAYIARSEAPSRIHPA